MTSQSDEASLSQPTFTPVDQSPNTESSQKNAERLDATENEGEKDDQTQVLNPLLLRSAAAPSKSRQRRDTLSISLLIMSMNNLQTRSVCNWTYSINTDPKRVPADLPEANCTSKTLPDTANVCEAILYYVPVQRQTTYASGGVMWTSDYQQLRVGCTLAKPFNKSTGPTTS